MTSALAAAIAAALIASSSAPAKPAPQTPKRITFLAKSVSQIAADPMFPQPGDTIAARLANLRRGRIAGGDSTACIVTDRSADLQCTATVGLRGGTLQAAFSQNLTSATVTGAITGGTGRYADARGVFTLRRVGSTSNFNAVVTLV